QPGAAAPARTRRRPHPTCLSQYALRRAPTLPSPIKLDDLVGDGFVLVEVDRADHFKKEVLIVHVSGGFRQEHQHPFGDRHGLPTLEVDCLAIHHRGRENSTVETRPGWIKARTAHVCAERDLVPGQTLVTGCRLARS